MQESPLLETFRQAGAAIGSYRGAQTALRLPAQAAAFASAALCDWSWRGRIMVAGPEARKWLNGVITANVRDLRAGQAVASFFLNSKGHSLHVFDIAALAPDSFLLLCDQSAVAGLADQLRRYVFRAQATITDQSQEGISLALCGPRAEAILASSGVAPLPPKEGLTTEAQAGLPQPIRILRWAWGGMDTFELLVEPATAAAIWERLETQGAIPAGAEEQERQRILHGIPRPGQDIRETDLPHETGQLHAVGLNKGCYIGQEIVERIRSRGAVHRQFSAFIFNGEVGPGGKILAADREVGEITSATPLAGGRTAALGYIRREAAEADAPLASNGATGQVATPPLLE